MEEPQLLNMRRVVKVRLPVGDGTSAMRESLNQDWIDAVAAIIERLEDRRPNLPLDLLKRLGMNAVFEALQDKESKVDISLGVAQYFKMIIEEIFRVPANRIRVFSNEQKKSSDRPWACVLFALGTRKLGLFFQFKDPYCTVYTEPSGEVLAEAVTLPPTPRDDAMYQTPMGSGSATSSSTKLDAILNKMAVRTTPVYGGDASGQPQRMKPPSVGKFNEKFY